VEQRSRFLLFTTPELAMKLHYLPRELPANIMDLFNADVQCCVTSRLAKGRHKRVRTFDCLM